MGVLTRSDCGESVGLVILLEGEYGRRGMMLAEMSSDLIYK